MNNINDTQWTVIGLLLILLFVEVVINPAIANPLKAFIAKFHVTPQSANSKQKDPNVPVDANPNGGPNGQQSGPTLTQNPNDGHTYITNPNSGIPAKDANGNNVQFNGQNTRNNDVQSWNDFNTFSSWFWNTFGTQFKNPLKDKNGNIVRDKNGNIVFQ